MIRTQSAAAKLALFALIAGAAVSTTSAYALPHFGIHRHPSGTADVRIALEVYNRGATFRDLQIEGKIYTVRPHESLAIKAPTGTLVFAGTTAALHRKGDLLFSVNPSMRNKVLPID